jgi:hypothetical protein
MSDPNITLMQTIRAKWGGAIDSACATSSALAPRGTAPAAFLAGLVANESSGDPNAKRFEKAVLASLWEVVQGRAPAFGSIKRDAILAYLAAAAPRNPTVPDPGFVRAIVAGALQQFDGLANSWGLTQVMGYEAIPFSIDAGELDTPEKGLWVTMRMLTDFATRFTLNPASDFPELFSCWNTGRAHARTADPQYIPNGLARMKIYENLVTGDS